MKMFKTFFLITQCVISKSALDHDVVFVSSLDVRVTFMFRKLNQEEEIMTSSALARSAECRHHSLFLRGRPEQ